MKKNELRKLFFKSLLLFVVSLSFASCSNLFGGGDSGSSSSESKPAEAQNQPKTFTVTGDIKITEELTLSGAIPEEYRSLFSSINNSDNSQERTAFPTVPTTGYYVTATAEGKDPVTVTPTTTANGASFSMDLPAEDPEKVWTIEAGMTASFNGSQVVILKDTCTASPPTFYHEFIIKPLAIDENSKGNVDLTITYETSEAQKPNKLEIDFGDNTTQTIDIENTETETTIILNNKKAGSYKAKLVFRKNGYVVYTDYQGINIFPNMTTNTWVSSGGNGPVTGSTYKLTDTLVQDYLLTQIYVGSTSISGVAFTADDTTGNGTVFAPFATFAKAIDYLQKNGDTSKAYTIWFSGEITGAQTISDGTESSPTPVKASSLTISGVTGNTSDSLKGGSSGSVLTVDTAVPVTITNLKITGGNADTGGGINITKGTVTLSTGALIADNSAGTSGGAIYVSANGNLKIASSAKVTKVNDSAISDKHNDIYLSASKTLEIVETLDSTATATITLPSLVRGTQVLSGSCTSANIEKIHVSDSEWNIISHSNVGKLDAPLYVSSATGASDSNTGTALHPYVTVKQATMQVWNTADDNETTINIVGEVTGVAGGATGAQQYVEVSENVTNPKIRLKGTTNTAKINPNPNNGTENRKALGINSKVDLTIEQLTITGGNTTGHGAGIYSNIAGVTLTLDTGAIVSGNTVNNTSGYAGGIYITGGNNDRAKLIMKSGSQIKGNYAVNGGGVYLSYADLCMSGTALIGESATSPATNTTGGNKATNGGGVYAESSGIVWLGYLAPSDNLNDVSPLTDGYGILHNYASACGGGIYNNGGTVKMKTGAISYNGTQTYNATAKGGGIYNLKGTVSLSGGQITRNQTSYGGGIYSSGEYDAVDAIIFLTGTALIGGSGTGDASDSTGNYAMPYQNTLYAGGGIFNAGGSIYLGYASCGNDGTPSNKTSLTGGICQNYASYQSQPSAQNTAYAGGVYMTNYGKLYFDSGNISYNSAGSGGGIYMDVNRNVLTMTGGTIAGNLAVNTSEGKGGAVYIVSLNGGSFETSISNFELSGTTASIPSTGIRNNDIYLNGSKITVNGNFATSFAAKITSEFYSDGKQILEPKSNSDSDIAYITNNFTKFSLTNSSYYIISNGTMFSAPSVQSVTTFENAKTYAACSQADLSYLASKVTATQSCEGATIKLANDITLSNSFSVIGYYGGGRFKGTLDGNGKTVTYNDVGISGGGSGRGLIGFAQNATIQNLNVTGSFTITGSTGPSCQYLGGIVGQMVGGTIKNCTSSVSFSYTTDNEYLTSYMGGIVGSSDTSDQIIIDDCVYTGTLTLNSSYNRGYAGGIIGQLGKGEVRNCINRGTITGVEKAGGIAGDLSQGTSICNCGNTGIIKSLKDSSYAGGICGYSVSTVSKSIDCCFSNGKVSIGESGNGNGYAILGGGTGEIGRAFFISGNVSGKNPGSTSTGDTSFDNTRLSNINTLNHENSSIYKEWVLDGTTAFKFRN